MIRRVIVLMIGALALASCGGASDVPAARPAVPHVIAADSKLLDDSGQLTILKQGDLAPDFQYTLNDGSAHKLSDLRGKKVLVNFWATWCGPCRLEMPDLQRALNDYGDAVVVLGVNKIENREVITPFADEVQVAFPLIPNKSGDISGRYGALNLPTSYFINTDGTIGFRQVGVMNYDFIKKHIDQLK
jgi:thiol-disulfide isomerase/thioredoxin